MFTIRKASRLLGVSLATLRRWEHNGTIKCVRTKGGQRRFEKTEIERLLGHPIDASPEKIEDTLREKKKAVKNLHLEIEKEKASKTLAQLKGDVVKKAKDELTLLRIQCMKERLIADKQCAEQDKKIKEGLKKWLEMWIKYAFKYFTLEFLFPGIEPEPIPLEWKVRIRQTIGEALHGVDINENIDSVRLLVENKVDFLRNEYNKEVICPQIKNELIQGAIAGLKFPSWIDKEAERLLTVEMRKILETTIHGDEDLEEVYAVGEQLKNEMIGILEERQ